ncbi:hypothetical protein CEE45_12595 [Candidatus Heimdallarchaeota archaeon B3_Heim]|nr:MAG: hypothetical protein CEE45_12595 [Candidatus Heimdallarchaeota archaeon B3_Heim]
MKPYITFTLEFKSREKKSSLLQSLMRICPFDHLPREIKRIKGKNAFTIQVFFQDVEYLEAVYQQLEKQSKDMKEQLTASTYGKVTKIEIGVVT